MPEPVPKAMRLKTASGKIHARRLRFFVGTRDETVVKATDIILLCGRKWITPEWIPDDEPVTCGVCLKAMNTGAHHL